MRIAKSPSFETGNHPLEFSGCQRESYCGRAKEVGKSTWGSVFAREYPSGVFARVVRHRLAIRENWVCIILLHLALDIYRSFIPLSLSQHIAHSRRVVIVDIAWNEFRDKAWVFSFVKRRLDHPPWSHLSGFITFTDILLFGIDT